MSSVQHVWRKTNGGSSDCKLKTSQFTISVKKENSCELVSIEWLWINQLWSKWCHGLIFNMPGPILRNSILWNSLKFLDFYWENVRKFFGIKFLQKGIRTRAYFRKVSDQMFFFFQDSRPSVDHWVTTERRVHRNPKPSERC